MMSAIGEKIDAVVREGLVGPLKEAGYKKTRRTFHLVEDSVVRVVNVQSTHWNIGDTGQFTINLGVYLPHIVKCMRDREPWPPGKLPAECDCTVRMRIGTLMPEGQDYWWKIDISSDLSEIAWEVEDAWVNYGRPWLHQDWGNLRVARDLLGSGVAAIAASLLLNEPDVAKRIALDQDWGNLRVARDLLGSGVAAIAASLLLNEPDVAKRIALDQVTYYLQNNEPKRAEWLKWRVGVFGVKLD